MFGKLMPIHDVITVLGRWLAMLAIGTVLVVSLVLTVLVVGTIIQYVLGRLES